MSYSSDVGLCLNSASKLLLDKALQVADEGIKKLFTYTDFKHDEVSGSVAYHWKHKSWYPDYPAIAFVEAFMNELDLDGDDDTEYLFIRVGEAYDDIEERGQFWDNPLGMRVVREVAFTPELCHLTVE